MGDNIDRYDELDAAGMMLVVRRALRLLGCANGNTAVEFALVAPPLFMLLVGGMYSGLLVYSVAGLHHAVEQAARCYSVDTVQCGSADAARTYAQDEYYGVGSPTFSASTAACGHRISASTTFEFNALFTSWSMPLSATACFP